MAGKNKEIPILKCRYCDQKISGVYEKIAIHNLKAHEENCRWNKKRKR